MADPGTPAQLTRKEFKLFRELIYAEAGISMSEAKFQLVESRLQKRLRKLQLNSFSRYYDFLQNEDRNGEERLQMINALTTNKTDFFRENHHFEYMREELLPSIEAQARETGHYKLRIWSAACSTGEEPYTLAMTLLEYFGAAKAAQWDIRILASDVDTDVLANAEQGVYHEDKADEIPADLRKRYFRKEVRGKDTVWVAGPELKQLIAFRRINFIESPWPINTSFDIIFCRNVMIYFDEPTQDRLVSRFAEQLVPEGHLFIGHSESIMRIEGVYRPLGKTIYRLNPGKGATSARSLSKAAQLPSPTPSTGLRRSTGAGLAASSGGTARERLRQRIDSQASTQSFSTGTMGKGPDASHAIIVGEIKASSSPCKVSTVVGSCIAVCLYDPIAHVGGMNHFMLPANKSDDRVCASYGVHAMELLINEIMKLGGDRRKLVAKVFGGGNVLKSSGCSLDIGGRNANFAMQFLDTDCIPIVSKDVGGRHGRQVQFLTHTGQAFVRPVKQMAEIEAEMATVKQREEKPVAEPAGCYGSVELF
ncbi:MAG: CheR family methyltransferase [Planctomycetaceae bacterium]